MGIDAERDHGSWRAGAAFVRRDYAMVEWHASHAYRKASSRSEKASE